MNEITDDHFSDLLNIQESKSFDYINACLETVILATNCHYCRVVQSLIADQKSDDVKNIIRRAITHDQLEKNNIADKKLTSGMVALAALKDFKNPKNKDAVYQCVTTTKNFLDQKKPKRTKDFILQIMEIHKNNYV